MFILKNRENENEMQKDVRIPMPGGVTGARALPKYVSVNVSGFSS